MSSLFETTYNPDVLSCIANLSNDEVFTPPDVANRMLDLLPEELWSDPNATFLDPACKSGVFLREIAKRLVDGLESEFPNLEERLEHIFKKQLFGIALTELTSLLSRRSVYCSKYPTSVYSVVRFDNPEGNIDYKRMEHKWVNGRCSICGAAATEYERDESLETYAYEFIHIDDPSKVFNMKFDVIIGNPPYQLSDGGNNASAKPIYHLFIQQAKKLNPRFLTMIVPSRWFAGGKGLDDFRAEMINDKRIRVLHDFLNASDCFGTGVEIKGGVCYFLWERDSEGPCSISTHSGDGILSTATRFMKQGNSDVFVRRNEAISILEKVQGFHEESFSQFVSSRKPFGLPTNVASRKQAKPGDIPIYMRGGIEYFPLKEIEKNIEWVNKDKIYITKAYNAGDDYPHQIINKPIVAPAGTCCSETYVVVGPFDSQEIANNVCSYMQTKFFRFLVSLKKISQDATQKVYEFVPVQDFSKQWCDDELYERYSFTEEEITFIDSLIKPMGLEGQND